jgi:2-haloacid dehalogenase
MSNDVRTVFDSCKTTTLTFDCYGTLVDWERGACRALRDLYPCLRSDVTDDMLIDLFLRAEARTIRENSFPYANALQRVAQCVAGTLRLASDRELEVSFANSLPAWPLFEEANPSLSRLARHYQLAIVSNVDNHLLSKTIEQFDVPFVATVTSEQTGSYKPDRAIFDRAVQLIGELPSRIVHIAEGRSEAAPARALGMRSIWVNRSRRSDDGSNAQANAVVSSLSQIVGAIS